VSHFPVFHASQYKSTTWRHFCMSEEERDATFLFVEGWAKSMAATGDISSNSMIFRKIHLMKGCSWLWWGTFQVYPKIDNLSIILVTNCNFDQKYLMIKLNNPVRLFYRMHIFFSFSLRPAGRKVRWSAVPPGPCQRHIGPCGTGSRKREPGEGP
jgi:hypothetical protein